MCTECRELKRHLIQVNDEFTQLQKRTLHRKASPPERRRLVRLKTDVHISKELLENHRATCEAPE